MRAMRRTRKVDGGTSGSAGRAEAGPVERLFLPRPASFGQDERLGESFYERLSQQETAAMRSKPFEQALEQLRSLCLALPEASEVEAWGHPTFRAGKKMFAAIGEDN